MARLRAVRPGVDDAALVKANAVARPEVAATAMRYQLSEESEKDAESAGLLREVEAEA